MKVFSVLTASILFGAIVTAFAHDDATLDKVTAPNGGQLRMAGPYHLELVVAKSANEIKDNPLYVYVTDHGGNAIDTKGASATVTLLTGKVKTTATLLPDSANRLTGTAKYGADSSLKAVVSLTLPGAPTEQARFTPMQPAK